MEIRREAYLNQLIERRDNGMITAGWLPTI